jgi:hypothetical protein
MPFLCANRAGFGGHLAGFGGRLRQVLAELT